ncbi:hypothetical protein H5410_014708 [Solanum commersonii]|uniref:Uncharacterized protein n=1 Tax=Solanum commersonii TaxID=4109 RepID=A0A9J5ZS77_SOLCO|nr:hypothetical protein H5410_014708 [Solanum commersonii]
MTGIALALQQRNRRRRTISNVWCQGGCWACINEAIHIRHMSVVFALDLIVPEQACRAYAARNVVEECYLVDSANSHMLVSKIKPCMCKYEQIQIVKLRMAH